MTLRITQYARFAIWSSRVPAADMSTVIGLEPDEVMVQGSRRATHPPIPRQHAWMVRSASGMPVDEQVEELVRRLKPQQAAIRELASDLQAGEGPTAGASLSIFRHLDEPDGEVDGYQHRLLGWHLSADVLEFVVDVGAEIDVDEYGQELPRWQWRRRRRYYAPTPLEDDATAIATDLVISPRRGLRRRVTVRQEP